ncbi:MAG TPA: TonB-dependent receptor [Phenylobacterium sp.]|nr:TonB-dependent receptor [Phenylobacterium sp.]
MRHRALSASASIIAIALATAAQAQTAPDAAVEEIVVTGSRLVRTGEQAPTPSTIVGTQELQAQAVTSIVNISRVLPQFRNQRGAQTGANNSQNGGQGSLDLRSLGANRNLVLLNGQRVVPSTGNGIVDINILPGSLVSRVDVVTGGASAAYGSDAVSGVVNFILDTRFQGVKGEIVGGIAEKGDNEEFTASLAFGDSFMDDRLHVVGSLEYYFSDGMKVLSRDFLEARGGIINNPAYTATNGQYRNIVTAGNIVAAYMSTGGLVNGCRTATGANIPNCALRGTAFGPDGSPHPFVYGDYVNPTGNMVVPIGSANPDYANIYDGVMQTHPSERRAFYGRAEYDVTEDVHVFADLILAKSKIGPTGNVPPYRFGTSATTWLSVTADNAFLAPEIKAQMSGPGGGNPSGPYYLNIGRFNYDWGGVTVPVNTNKTTRFTIGMRGDLTDKWSFDAYVAYGKNDYLGTGTNNLLTSHNGVVALGEVNLATDAVVAPAGNAAGIPAGTIVCRSTLTNPGNGCKPLNIFGVGNASPEAIQYIMGSHFLATTYEQRYVEASIQGRPFELWAGPVSVAAGASYRSEEVAATVDDNSLNNNFGIANSKPYAGEERVLEGFGEIGIPLMEGLNVDFAGRVTHYETSGRVETWKVGATWDLPGPLSDLKLRASRSRDIRAPSLSELFTGFSQSRGSVIDPFQPGNVTFNIQSYTGGNPALKPEVADTLALGVVYRPSWAPGLSGSIDYYDIDIQDAIGTLNAQNTVDRCFQGNAAICDRITRDAQGNIIGIYVNNLNVAALQTSGLDIEVNYRREIDGLFGDEPATVGARLFANYVDKFRTYEGVGAPVEEAGSIRAQQPKWTAQALWYYGAGPYQLTVINRYIGGGRYDNAFEPGHPSYVPNAIEKNKVKARFYTSLTFNYDFEALGSKAEAFVNVNNVFDVKPPFGFAFNYGLTASPMYDVIGRAYKVGLRFRY